MAPLGSVRMNEREIKSIARVRGCVETVSPLLLRIYTLLAYKRSKYVGVNTDGSVGGINSAYHGRHGWDDGY